MIELLEQLDQARIIECSCLLQGKDIIESSFPEAVKGYETVAKQAFSYIFMNVARAKAKHNEAHLDIGDKRLSAFLVKRHSVLICLSNKAEPVQKVKGIMLDLRKVLINQQLARKTA